MNLQSQIDKHFGLGHSVAEIIALSVARRPPPCQHSISINAAKHTEAIWALNRPPFRPSNVLPPDRFGRRGIQVAPTGKIVQHVSYAIPEPQLEAQLEPQLEAQLEPQLEAQPEPQPETQLEAQLEPQLEPQPEVQSEAQPEPQPEPQM